MVDSGAEINLIKQSCLQDTATVNFNNTLALQGISSDTVRTIRSVIINLLEQPTEFHILPEDTTLKFHGLLGNPFFKLHNASIDYGKRSVICDKIYIPFKEESLVSIQPRSITPFHCVITNPERTQGYVSPLQSIEGLILGNALVLNSNGKAYMNLINTTEDKMIVEIPQVALKDFDILSPLSDVSGSHLGRDDSGIAPKEASVHSASPSAEYPDSSPSDT